MNENKIKDFKDLIVWQKSMILVELVYKLSAKLPRQEDFGLASQIKRSAVSIPSNIAEGKSRSSRKDFAQFVFISRGSVFELETQLLLLERIFKISTQNERDLCIEIGKMLSAIITKLRN